MYHDKPSKKKIILWNMNYILDSANPNIGDRALLTSIINNIKKHEGSIQIIVFSRNYKLIRNEFGVEGVNYNPANILKIIKAILQCDLFVFAGGEVLVDRGSLLYTPFMLHASLLAKVLRKRVLGYGIGIGKLHEISWVSKWLSRLVFNNATVSVRDEVSMETLSLICKTGKIYCTADPVLNLEPCVQDETEKLLKDLGINIKFGPLIGIVPRQPLMPVRGKQDKLLQVIPIKIREKLKLTPPGFNEKINKYIYSLSAIADYLVDKYNAQVLLIPMFKGFMSYKDDELCNNILKKVSNKSKVNFVDKKYPVDCLKGLFGKMDMVIGMPLHSIILASSMGVPAIAFSYESKVERYMKLIDCEQFSHQMEDINYEIDIEEIKDKIDIIMSSRVDIVKKIKAKVSLLKEKELDNIKIFLEEIRGVNT